MYDATFPDGEEHMRTCAARREFDNRSFIMFQRQSSTHSLELEEGDLFQSDFAPVDHTYEEQNSPSFDSCFDGSLGFEQEVSANPDTELATGDDGTDAGADPVDPVDFRQIPPLIAVVPPPQPFVHCLYDTMAPVVCKRKAEAALGPYEPQPRKITARSTSDSSCPSTSGRSCASSSEDKCKCSGTLVCHSCKRNTWTDEEDRILVKVVTSIAHHYKNRKMDWREVAARLENRNSKQCRERFNMTLNPRINKGAWTIEEDRIILREHNRLGNKWATIRSKLNNRTDTQVRTRHSTLVKGINRDQSIRWNATLDAQLKSLCERFSGDLDLIRRHLPSTIKGCTNFLLLERCPAIIPPSTSTLAAVNNSAPTWPESDSDDSSSIASSPCASPAAATSANAPAAPSSQRSACEWTTSCFSQAPKP